MSQLFSNNAETTIAAPLTDAATSVTFADGSKFQAPTGGDYELLTLIAAGEIEIVRLTARTGNTGTITRAQESTTARAWVTGTRVFAGVTAGTLTDAVTGGAGLENQATGFASVAVGGSSQATGSYAAALGVEAEGNANYVTAMGWRSRNSGQYATAIGTNTAGEVDGTALGAYAYADTQGVAAGRSAEAVSPGGIAVGYQTYTYTDFPTPGVGRDIAIGYRAICGADYGIAIGATAEVDFGKTGGIAIGDTYTVRNRTMQVGALQVVPRVIKSGTDADAIWQSTGPQTVVMTAAKDLKTLASYTLDLPTGVTFYPDEVGVIITAASGVTGQPTVRFGITGDEAKHLAATGTTGLDAAYDRQRFATLLSDDGAKTLRAEVTVAATGTTLTGRFYWRGTAVADT
jgi:hypothetical protein